MIVTRLKLLSGVQEEEVGFITSGNWRGQAQLADGWRRRGVLAWSDARFTRHMPKYPLLLVPFARGFYYIAFLIRCCYPPRAHNSDTY